jgi:cytoplasmic iron level regulating protein YaaA (DUF328/UPF0246 family)
MLVVVSPAKRLNEKPPRKPTGSTPVFLGEAALLAKRAGELSAAELESLMRISPRLAALNSGRFANFSTGVGAKQAVELFAGDTYVGLEAVSLDDGEMIWAQDHLRILSGLYGLLRPCDLIQPHRLEMGSRLATERGGNLYEFWGDRIAQALNAQARALNADVLINCASIEYFKAVAPAALKLRVITPVFLEDHEGGPRVLSLWAKRARGAFARFAIERRITNPEGLKDFDTGGYQFRPDMSEGDRWIFLRQS